MTMSEHFLLADAETVEYAGETFTHRRFYFHSGLRNAPMQVWAAESGRRCHYRPQTGEAIVIEQDGDRVFVQPVESDGDTVRLEEAR